MKRFILFFLLAVTLNSFAQSDDKIVFYENEHTFEVSIPDILEYFHFDSDSVSVFEKDFTKNLKATRNYSSDESISFGDYVFDFRDLLILMKDSKHKVTIKKNGSNDSVAYKLKVVTISNHEGMGGSRIVSVVIRNKKSKKVIVEKVIERSLPC